jgi:phosphoenolpyruvate synthase/pyruvate phosphate dikinase
MERAEGSRRVNAMAIETSTHVRRLEQLSREDSPFAGAKGAGLGELIRAAFPVPQGFVVGAPARLEQEPVDAAVREAYADLGDDVAVTVRPSRTAEAGRRDTCLEARGADEVVAAVRRSRASDEHVAVVVQRQIAAAAAGVMFTVDPATGNQDHLVIETAAGAGTSGEVSPDRYVVDKMLLGIVTREAHVPVLDDRQIRLVADLGRSVEHRCGAPQAIEWAIDESGRPWLLDHDRAGTRR